MSQEHLSFRHEIDQFMQDHPQSPLSPEQRDSFAGLNYYAPLAEWVIAAPLVYYDGDEPTIEMETSTGDIRHYRRWAKFMFTVEGESAELTIYSDPWGESLFLPFKDATSGGDSYGAGRYLDNHRPGLSVRGDQVVVDFNYGYNPYCAYSAAYSCPLPPSENWLTVSIQAGEKKFKK